MTGGSSMKSLTLGGASGKQTLALSAESPNTNLNATTTGISINPNAAIVLTCPALPTGCNGGPSRGPNLNAGSSTITNEGAITVAATDGTGTIITGAGTVIGSVSNTGGVVAPGASPGTLTLNGHYTQGASGRLEIEVAGPGTGQFDKLAVSGNATLGGTLALQPSAGYVTSSALGDSVAFLTYGGARTDPFSATTVSLSLACPKQLAAVYNDGPKNVSAVVNGSGASCPGPGGGGVIDPVPEIKPPNTVLNSHPRPTVKTKKAKAKVRFTFSADQAGAAFQCKLDKGPFVSCPSPKTYKVKAWQTQVLWARCRARGRRRHPGELQLQGRLRETLVREPRKATGLRGEL